MRKSLWLLSVAGVTAIVSSCLAAWLLSGNLQDILDGSSCTRLDATGTAGARLAVVVGVFEGDTERALASLKQWPAVCSRSTLYYVDLILYQAEDLDEQQLERLRRRVPAEASKCFRSTRAITGRLTPKENVYPIGPSAQFYDMFLEPSVRENFVEYDAVAILEWDITVAHKSSFERLYSAAFSHDEPFWVKGSTLAGIEFQDTALLPEMWHVLGHLNGNAIYNNTDPAFLEFVNFTRHRWGYTYPYDVALWATISDFPYSWPLWQRYSSKFVATKLISNIGFYDVSTTHVSRALVEDTLFVHGSASSRGSAHNVHKRDEGEAPEYVDVNACKRACSSPSGLPVGISTVCDHTCVAEDPLAGRRFGGHNCGAGNPRKYGHACRLCYLDKDKAIEGEEALSETGLEFSTPAKHVIMCRTERPPESVDCSDECEGDPNTICDRRCGSGRYGDTHCNWKELGEKCRFCFRDPLAAVLADDRAKAQGGRVIMCHSHEPPPPGHANARDVTSSLVQSAERKSNDVDEQSDEDEWSPGSPVFPGNTTREQLCAFLPGYFEFLNETSLTVASVRRFMPGMRTVIATHPVDFHVYNRTLGQAPDVTIINASYPQYASLIADLACGVDTRLIYYISPGQLVTRTFTAKDTHSPRGDLIVTATDAEVVGIENLRRTMTVALLLGFHAPSFTYGADLILPAETNAQLRMVLHDAAMVQGYGKIQLGKDGVDFHVLHTFLTAVTKIHRMHSSLDIPEVLAALLYSCSPTGVAFVNGRQWNHQNLLKSVSIWDIPLLKPRFTCTVDMSLSLEGYDVARELSAGLNAFRHGARCDRGFIDIHEATLQLKPDWEFGARTSLHRMPGLEQFRISVMYRTFRDDAKLFKDSLPSVFEHFPSALEAVVVVVERDATLFERLLAPLRESAPFPVRLVTEPSIMDGHIQQKYSKMRADLYTEGEFVLHLDSDVLLFEEVTYDHIFHLGKPVLPFRRYRSDTEVDRRLKFCWQEGTSHAVQEEVVHEFSIFNTHVYPRALYGALRAFIEEVHDTTFTNFVSAHVGKCDGSFDKTKRRLSDFNVMGAFMWYHMHDAVHWMAADPLDVRPDEWRRDLTKYAWVCQANGRLLPDDEAGQKMYMLDYKSVKSVEECRMVTEHWRHQRMQDPKTRTPLTWPVSTQLVIASDDGAFDPTD